MDTHSWLPDVTESVAEPTPENAPFFTVAKGEPSSEELSAVVAVLLALTREDPPARQNDDRPIAAGWKSYWRVIRQPLIPGREAWRGSLR